MVRTRLLATPTLYKFVGIVTSCVLISQIRLWDENLWIRLYNHRKKKGYKPERIPFVSKFTPLDGHLVQKVHAIIEPKCCTLKTSAVTRTYGAFDADGKGGALYYNHLTTLCTDEELCMLHRLRDSVLNDVSAILGKPVYPFRSSMWNVFYLAYTGTQGQFGWHYDHEEKTDYRVLICVDATDGAGAVEFIDSAGAVQSVELATGEAYVLCGSQTYHRVRPNKTDKDRRIMLGFHCSTVPDKSTLNMCYFANLTGWRVLPSLQILWNQQYYRDMVNSFSTEVCRLMFH